MAVQSVKYSIPVKGLSAGKHHFVMALGDGLMQQFDCLEVRDVKVEASIEAQRGAAGVAVEAKLVGEVTVECDRCLEELTLPVDYTGAMEIRFISDHSPEKETRYDGEVMWLGAGEAAADLSAFLYESVILALPYRKVHPEGGCDPQMMERFKKE